jgi:hypothetical protein
MSKSKTGYKCIKDGCDGELMSEEVENKSNTIKFFKLSCSNPNCNFESPCYITEGFMKMFLELRSSK